METKIIENPVIFVVGPTASGKSKFALDTAKRFGGAIINFDSIQFYRDLEIGSSSPSQADKSQAPHFLFSYVPAPQEMTAGQFLRDLDEVFSVIQNTVKPHEPLIFVGGTGFYQQAIENGMFDVPSVSQELKDAVLSEMQTHEGADRLFRELAVFDPDHGLHQNDHYRIGRAIEVKRAFGLSMSELRGQNLKKLFHIPKKIKIGIDQEKEVLEQKIKNRTHDMLEKGLVEETKRILDVLKVPWSPLDSVGYKETVQHLKGVLALKDLPEAISLSTRQLVKKQRTWFKRDASVLWSTQLPVEEAIEQFLLKESVLKG